MDDPVAALDDIAQARLDDIASDRYEEVEAAKQLYEQSQPRVFTYTRTYRIETSLPDEELIEHVNKDEDNNLGFVHNATSLIEVFDALSIEHECGVEMEGIKVEVHSTAYEVRDPGFF